MSMKTKWCIGLAILILVGCVTKLPTPPRLKPVARVPLLKRTTAAFNPTLMAPTTITGTSSTAPTITLLPVFLGDKHTGFAAYWVQPDTNVWYPEWSTNLVDWNCCAGEGATIPDRATRQSGAWCTNCAHFVETSTNWVSQWFVRLRKL